MDEVQKPNNSEHIILKAGFIPSPGERFGPLSSDQNHRFLTN
jgi:hypothetical protein